MTLPSVSNIAHRVDRLYSQQGVGAMGKHMRMGKRRSNFLDTAKAAQELGLSKHTLENMRCTAFGPVFHKFLGRVLYHRDDLKRWSRRHRRRSTSGVKA